jgi:hypothetical protein
MVWTLQGPVSVYLASVDSVASGQQIAAFSQSPAPLIWAWEQKHLDFRPTPPLCVETVL